VKVHSAISPQFFFNYREDGQKFGEVDRHVTVLIKNSEELVHESGVGHTERRLKFSTPVH